MKVKWGYYEYNNNNNNNSNNNNIILKKIITALKGTIWDVYNLLTAPRTVSNTSELNLGFSKKEVIPSLPLKKGGSSLPSHKKRREPPPPPPTPTFEHLSRANVMLRATWYEGTAQLSWNWTRNQRAWLTASFWSKMTPKTLADYRRHRDQEMNAPDWLIYTTRNERSLLICSFSGRDCTFTLSRRRKLQRWLAKSECISTFVREPARTKTR